MAVTLRISLALALALLAAGARSGGAPTSPSERWLSLLRELARSSPGAGAGADALQPFTVDLPVGDGRAATLPLLVLPLPLPVPVPPLPAPGARSHADCSQQRDETIKDSDSADEIDAAARRGGFPRRPAVSDAVEGKYPRWPAVTGAAEGEGGYPRRPAISDAAEDEGVYPRHRPAIADAAEDEGVYPRRRPAIADAAEDEGIYPRRRPAIADAAEDEGVYPRRRPAIADAAEDEGVYPRRRPAIADAAEDEGVYPRRRPAIADAAEDEGVYPRRRPAIADAAEDEGVYPRRRPAIADAAEDEGVYPRRRPAIADAAEDESVYPRRPAISGVFGGDEPRPFAPRRPLPRPEPAYDDSPNLLPAADLKVTSQQLVDQFRAQAPTAPHLPPAVLGAVRAGGVGGARAAGGERAQGEEEAGAAEGGRYLPPAPRDAAAPPRPSFARSMRLRAELTVPRSDYTEPYTVWWDALSGASRTEFHDRGQGTVCYRMPLSNGRMQRVEVRTDRTGERAAVACGVARAESATPEDRAHPALPDIQLFSFAGYTEEDGAHAELWRYELRGAEGALGAARGERLHYRHELVLTRDAQDVATPLRYTVTADSSVLGAHCDAYEHRYLRVAHQQHDAGVFDLDIERQCDQIEELDARRGEHLARLEPLREFTLPQRDPRHDEGLLVFKGKFERKYSDDTEEALRKNLLVQHTRFVTSCNRMGAPFEVEVNFLADRLDAELEVLLGAAFHGEVERAQRFPYSARQLRREAGEQPAEFDWRPRGAVSPVKYQGSCSSCWAFAVVGAVEGALFVRTRALVELSEQCLVDCAHSHGANGCRGTWPSHAYDYATERGLPARAEYAPYAEKVLQCRDRRVPPVTHISGYVNVAPNDTGALKVAIRKHAPTVVVVDAKPNSFMFYKKGVLRDERCIKGPKKKLNHAVLAVGWGKQRDETHFILKNTYSAKWGDGGYIRLHGDSNTCGVLTFPSYPRLRAPDVDRLPPGTAGAGTGDDGPADDGAGTGDDGQDQ